MLPPNQEHPATPKSGDARVPALDLEVLLGEHGEKRCQEELAILKRAMQGSGFVKIYNYGIPPSDVTKMHVWCQKFFTLPEPDKAYTTTEGEKIPRRGWIRPGMENANNVSSFNNGRAPLKHDKIDLKEVFDYGSQGHELVNRFPDPKVMPGFKEDCDDFYVKVVEIRRRCYKAIALAFGIPGDFFDPHCDPVAGANGVRFLSYPPCTVDELVRDGFKRCGEHSDTGDLTLLFQDDVGGLQLEDYNNPGTFYDVQNTEPGEMLVNVGDTLQRWTNGHMRSSCHRVMLPEHLKNSPDGIVPARYSIAVLGKPLKDTDVGPMPAFLKGDEKPKYKHQSYWDYSQHKYSHLFSVATEFKASA